MQDRTRFMASAGLVLLGALLTFRPAGTATASESLAGYAFPSIVGTVPEKPAEVDPRAVLADALAIVQAAGVPTSGEAVLAVVQQAQGERFNYFDPAARDDRGEQIWGKNGAALPADSMSMLRNRLQAAMIIDYAATLQDRDAATALVERFDGVTIAAIESYNRSSLSPSDPRFVLASEFAALPIGSAVLLVNEAVLAEGLRLTFPVVFRP